MNEGIELIEGVQGTTHARESFVGLLHRLKIVEKYL